MTLLDTPFVKGLRLVKRISDSSRAKALQLISSNKDGDLLEQTLQAGDTIRILPASPEKCEIFYILEGGLSLGKQRLQPQQLVAGDELRKPGTLTAYTPSKVLRFSAPPREALTFSSSVPSGLVSFESGSLQLLYSSGNTELSLMTLKRDMRFFIVPNEEGQVANEVYYILEGELSFQHEERHIVLSRGDYVVAEGLEEAVAFQGLSDVSMVYFSSQPSFDYVGQEAEKLMQLADSIEQKDGYTADHCKRIQDFSLRTAEYMGLSHTRLYLLNYGAYLHDVGKAKLPEGMLQKPGKLTPQEWTIMKQHPTLGRELLENSFLQEVGALVEQHHERLDGSGYPKGLKGLEISLEAFIIAVADTFDAMTTDRPYRAALPVSHALAELRKYAGQHYPKEVVEAFITANGLE
jgi:putative nucleotidyltransferase with HDIG domain